MSLERKPNLFIVGYFRALHPVSAALAARVPIPSHALDPPPTRPPGRPTARPRGLPHPPPAGGGRPAARRARVTVWPSRLAPADHRPTRIVRS